MRRWLWLAPLCLLALQYTALNAQVSELAPERASSSGDLAPASEAGQRLLIRGTVRNAATGEPVAGASLYIYQTDARGYYTLDPSNDSRNPRLHLHLRTSATGEFEARSIRPGSYPQTDIPQHVHFVVQAPGFARRVFEIVFDDDPKVTASIRRRAAEPFSDYALVAPRAEGSGWRVEYDILLRN